MYCFDCLVFLSSSRGAKALVAGWTLKPRRGPAFVLFVAVGNGSVSPTGNDGACRCGVGVR